MPVPAAMPATRRIAQQNVEPPGLDVMAKRAILEIDLEIGAIRVGYPALLNLGGVKTL